MLLAVFVSLAVSVVLVVIGAAGYVIEKTAARHEAKTIEGRRT